MMDYYSYGPDSAGFLLLQPEGEHDETREEKEYELIKKLSGFDDFRLVIIPVDSWNRDLSPWPAPPVFGKEPFGDGAGRTLRIITEELLPELQAHSPSGTSPKIILGGYSLAGLFALWASYEADCFDAAAACSPSVWFPGFMDYQREHEIRTKHVYLSLGDREEKAKNRVFAAVGDCIRESDRLLRERGVNSVLEWNPGNHFVDGELRTAKGFSWAIRQLQNSEGLTDNRELLVEMLETAADLAEWGVR